MPSRAKTARALLLRPVHGVASARRHEQCKWRLTISPELSQYSHLNWKLKHCQELEFPQKISHKFETMLSFWGQKVRMPIK